MDAPRDFDTFYTGTSRRLVAQVYALVGDRSEAEDAVAEAYARAWQRWPTVSGYEDPAAWVRTVAYRIAVSSWRRALNRRSAHARLDHRPAAPPPGPEVVLLAQALRRLPLAQRRALVLYYLADLPVQRIADETGASLSAVKAQLSRGRRALAALLDREATWQTS